MIDMRLSSPEFLTIPELIAEARQETALFQRYQATESCCTYELWRRAIVLRDDWAWSAVYGLYAPVVSARILLRVPNAGEDLEALVNQAFARFAHAVTEQKWRDFACVGALLGYLKCCAQSAATDYHRWQPRQHDALDSLPSACEPLLKDCSETVMERLAAQELWRLVSGEAPAQEEQLVLLLVVAQGMSPRALQQRYPTIYPTVQDIYRIRRNVIERLQRNKELRQFHHSQAREVVS
jgi:hypothetical protein